MSASAVEALLAALRPHIAFCALACARLLPVAWLCPLFGGRSTPGPVRLAVGLGLALLLGAAGSPVPAAPTVAGLAAACLHEACLGTALGLLAAAPFEAARFGGQMADLLRGASAEASLPGIGSRESAMAEVLAQMALALGLGTGALGWTVRALLRSTVLVPLGTPLPGQGSVLAVAGAVGGILASGLALSAPVAGLALALDAVVGFATRGGHAPGIGDVATPARILGGATVVWLALGVAADRVLAEVAAAPDALSRLSESFR